MRGPNRFRTVDRLFDAVTTPGALLELGCGDGRILARARQRGYTVVGIDISAKPLKRAREWGLDTVVLGDGERLPFADRSFSTVVSGFFSANLMDRERMLAEAYRVLKPGGSLAYSMLNPTTRVLDLFQHRLRSGKSLDLGGLKRHWVKLGRPADEIARLRRNGFIPRPLRGPLYLPGLRRLDPATPPVLTGRFTELAWEVVVAGIRPYDGAGRTLPESVNGAAVKPLALDAMLARSSDLHYVFLVPEHIEPGGVMTGTLAAVELSALGDACVFATATGLSPPVLRQAVIGVVGWCRRS
ncbi:MAG: SAM-dependent methyltransferase [Myxococcota bacterium]|jgi:SAM-dependent methyltransferase